MLSLVSAVMTGTTRGRCRRALAVVAAAQASSAWRVQGADAAVVPAGCPTSKLKHCSAIVPEVAMPRCWRGGLQRLQAGGGASRWLLSQSSSELNDAFMLLPQV